MLFIYGFGPFDEYIDNVTIKVIDRLPPELRGQSRVFDVVFDRSMFISALGAAAPKLVLGLGQTRDGDKLRVERLTWNSMASPNSEERAIDEGATDICRAVGWELPLTDICEHSDNPGTYVCNFSMWTVGEWASANGARSAFIHIPRAFDPQAAADYVCAVVTAAKDFPR